MQDHCSEVLDKYVEMDTVTILVNVLLLRLESYRHLMYNVPLSIPVSCGLLQTSFTAMHTGTATINCSVVIVCSIYPQ